MNLTDWLVAGLAAVALGALALVAVQASVIRDLRRQRSAAYLSERRIRFELRDLLAYVNRMGVSDPQHMTPRVPRPPAAVVPISGGRRRSS